MDLRQIEHDCQQSWSQSFKIESLLRFIKGASCGINKSKKDIEAHIKEKLAEREAIQQRMAQLKKERTEYLRNLPTESDSETLEAAIINTLRKQAAKKNFLL